MRDHCAGYGGVSIWSLDFDDFNNRCHRGPFPLLSTVRRAFEGAGLPPQNSRQPQAPSTTTPFPPEALEEAATEPWDDGSFGVTQG